MYIFELRYVILPYGICSKLQYCEIPTAIPTRLSCVGANSQNKFIHFFVIVLSQACYKKYLRIKTISYADHVLQIPSAHALCY